MAFTGTLRPFQNEAVDLMVSRRKALVAYDLGLGKTVLTIAAIESIRETRDVDGVLVICLSSLKYQWQDEVAKFSDRTALVIDGTAPQRRHQYAMIDQYDYVIVNYEQVVNDWDEIHAWEFAAIVMDEATALKGFRSQRAKQVKALARTIDVRFGLTGTPIENGRPEELFSIMQAIDGTVLGRFDLFDRAYIERDKWGGVAKYKNLAGLHTRMQRASVRKSQNDPDVAPYLPETIPRTPVVVPFDKQGAIVYRHIANDLLADLDAVADAPRALWSLEAHYGEQRQAFDPEEMAAVGRAMSKIMALRMLCDHPSLLTISGLAWDPMADTGGSQYLFDLLHDHPDIASALTKAKAPKLDAVYGLVRDHLSEDENKVVVFTSFVDMAAGINTVAGGVVYTGELSAKQKQAAKVRFQTDPDVRVFTSSDAGGYGVDLPQANLLLNYDLPWSSGLATQRNGRIKRVSSRWPSIVVQDIVMKDSIDVWMRGVLDGKDAVASAVIDGKGINKEGGVNFSAGGLADFLREHMP
jgi:SNF2 family DNA or RNA helicase